MDGQKVMRIAKAALTMLGAIWAIYTCFALQYTQSEAASPARTILVYEKGSALHKLVFLGTSLRYYKYQDI